MSVSLRCKMFLQSPRVSSGASLFNFFLRSVGTAVMRNFDWFFTQRWSFVFSDVCMTLRIFCESVIVVGTRSTHTHEATMWLLQWLSVQSQYRHRPSVPHKAPQREAEKMCVDRWHKACRAAVQRATLQLPSICKNEVLTNCDVRQPWSLMRAKTACACCARPKEHGSTSNGVALHQNCIQARWSLRREDVCVLKDTKGPVQLLGGAAPLWCRRGADIDL